MPHDFKVWNQGNDGQTMGVRVSDVNALAAFAASCTQPDVAGLYPDLQSYLNAAAHAHVAAPTAYTRIVDVVWLSPLGYAAPQFFPGRTLVATYTGPEREAGGFASQCYVIVDPQGFPALAPHHRQSIRVEYIPHGARDVLVVLP